MRAIGQIGIERAPPLCEVMRAGGARRCTLAGGRPGPIREVHANLYSFANQRARSIANLRNRWPGDGARRRLFQDSWKVPSAFRPDHHVRIEADRN